MIVFTLFCCLIYFRSITFGSIKIYFPIAPTKFFMLEDVFSSNLLFYSIKLFQFIQVFYQLSTNLNSFYINNSPKMQRL